MVVTRGLWIRRKGELLYNSFLQDEKALEICFTTNVKILNITICSKMGKMVKFYVKYFFFTIKIMRKQNLVQTTNVGIHRLGQLHWFSNHPEYKNPKF